MEDSLPPKGKFFPRPAGVRALDRLASFRITYLAIFAFVVLYVFTVQGAEWLLERHVRAGIERAAAEADWTEGSVVAHIQALVAPVSHDSRWARFGGAEIAPLVLGKDGTPIYVGRVPLPAPEPLDPGAAAREAERLLPAIVDVGVTVPHNSLLANGILVAYAALLVQGLFLYNRALARREEALLAEALAARDATASRAQGIEAELGAVRQRLAERSEGEGHAEEIRALRDERGALQRKLDALAEREEELLAKTSQFGELESERGALEELLEEAVHDLDTKDEELRALRSRLKRATKALPTPAGRAREADHLARRLRTLYKNLEIDDRALADLLALRDDTMKLKAEEGLKRLSDDADTAAVRRKLGGLPPGMPVFELGFAGKGRIYYTNGTQRRHRVLCVGAKNTQKPDLEYLSRIVKG